MRGLVMVGLMAACVAGCGGEDSDALCPAADEDGTLFRGEPTEGCLEGWFDTDAFRVTAPARGSGYFTLTAEALDPDFGVWATVDVEREVPDYSGWSERGVLATDAAGPGATARLWWASEPEARWTVRLRSNNPHGEASQNYRVTAEWHEFPPNPGVHFGVPASVEGFLAPAMPGATRSSWTVDRYTFDEVYGADYELVFDRLPLEVVYIRFPTEQSRWTQTEPSQGTIRLTGGVEFDPVQVDITYRGGVLGAGAGFPPRGVLEGGYRFEIRRLEETQ